jgi:hypothetical protein
LGTQIGLVRVAEHRIVARAVAIGYNVILLGSVMLSYAIDFLATVAVEPIETSCISPLLYL